VDTVFVRALTAECVIGVFDWEREIRQRVEIDLWLDTDIRCAAATDRIEDTVDYKGVSKRILALVERSEFALIESLAERVAAVCLEARGVRRARVRVTKPGAVRHAAAVGVEIERPAPDRLDAPE